MYRRVGAAARPPGPPPGGSGCPGAQDSSKGGAVETGCSELYGVI